MKTKAYKIYAQNGQDYLEVSENVGNFSLNVKTSNSGVITLDRDGWKDLMGIDYDIKVNDPPSFDDCQPRMAVEAITELKEKL